MCGKMSVSRFWALDQHGPAAAGGDRPAARAAVQLEKGRGEEAPRSQAEAPDGQHVQVQEEGGQRQVRTIGMMLRTCLSSLFFVYSKRFMSPGFSVAFAIAKLTKT